MMFDHVIVRSMIPHWPLLDSFERRRVVADVTAHVSKSVSAAPPHIRMGVSVVSVFIGSTAWLACLGAGGPLIRAERTSSLYEFLKRLPGPAWPVVRLYRSMTLLAFYDHPLVAAKLTSCAFARDKESVV